MKLLKFVFFIAAFTALPLLSETTKHHAEEEVSPNEDLMQEHGLLSRLLLIYEEVARKIDNGERYNAESLKRAATIVHTFLEGHHEKIEEKYIFPKLEEKKQYRELVSILKAQHGIGRKITTYIMDHASDADAPLAVNLYTYANMFRPHAAREDTIVFPAFRKMVSQKEYEELAEIFEEEEEELFGKDCFERFVAEITEIEKELGIHDLNEFSAK